MKNYLKMFINAIYLIKNKMTEIGGVHFNKVMHLVLGTSFYAVLGLFTQSLTALIATFVLAVAMEALDKITRKGYPEFWDIIATIILPVLLYFH